MQMKINFFLNGKKVQEEIARRASLEPKGDYSSPRGTGQYCSKYLLTEILICGCCGAHYNVSTGIEAVSAK